MSMAVTFDYRIVPTIPIWLVHRQRYLTLSGPQTSPEAPRSGTLITLAELHRLATLLACDYDIDICLEPDRHWVVMVMMAGRCYGLCTVRGKLRRWGRLESVLAYVALHCSGHGTIRLNTPWGIFVSIHQ